MGGYVPPGYQPTGQPAPFGSGGPPPITNQPTAAEGKHSKNNIMSDTINKNTSKFYNISLYSRNTPDKENINSLTTALLRIRHA